MGNLSPTHFPANRRQSHLEVIYLGFRRQNFFALFFPTVFCQVHAVNMSNIMFLCCLSKKNLHGVKLGQKNLKDRKQFVLLTGYRTGEPRCATFFHAVLVAN